jgi:hypothetical protein
MGNNALSMPTYAQAMPRAALIFGCQSEADWEKFLSKESRDSLLRKVLCVLQLESETGNLVR